MSEKIKKRKIMLVGTGFVGMSFAYSMLSEKGIDELVLVDVNEDKARGEQMDLSDGMAAQLMHGGRNVGRGNDGFGRGSTWRCWGWRV